MTTLLKIGLTCPVCATTFPSYKVISTNTFGGQRTDFHVRAAGTQPLLFLIHACDLCGFCGREESFTEPNEISTMLTGKVWAELAPKVPFVNASDKYEAAAKIALWNGEEIQDVANFYLRAAWCTIDEGDTEAERYYRLRAAWRFEDALRYYDEVEASERAVTTYLVGELWRRIGDRKYAAKWFDRVYEEVTDHTKQEWLVKAAEQQRDCPREWFG